jgi:glycosyltransferase involved in cell wall biosynthesis
MKISVIVCAHNPREDYFEKALDSLKNQTLCKSHWELLVVDNCSKEVLSRRWEIGWHPNGRHLIECQEGLTFARICGINESQGDLIIFVDDDNVLKSNYLEKALEIHLSKPWIGAWSGSVIANYESPVSSYVSSWESLLAVRKCDEDTWGNRYNDLDITPFGAGMCVKKEICTSYVIYNAGSSKSHVLDRKGSSLMGAGDIDIAYMALDLGFGIGRFKELELVHLIPEARTSLKYLCSLAFGSGASFVALLAKRKNTKKFIKKPRIKRLLNDFIFSFGKGMPHQKISYHYWLGLKSGYSNLSNR